MTQGGDQGLDAALEAVNARFHAEYERARGDNPPAVPLFVVLADSLILHRAGRRYEAITSPPEFHAIKAVVHAPVAAFAAAWNRGTSEALADDGKSFRARLLESAAAIDHLPLPADARARLREIVSLTLAFVEHPSSPAGFARGVGPLLLQSTDDAVAVQLDALDQHVHTLLRDFDATERATFEVIVAGAHQARARSLGMQYFGTLLGAGKERRLAYAESAEDEAAALLLARTRQLDRAIASAFFAEPERLERDILGDAVARRLALRKLTALV